MNKKIAKRGLGKVKGKNKSLLEQAGQGVFYTALEQLFFANEIIKLLKEDNITEKNKEIIDEYLGRYESEKNGTTES